MLDRPHTLQGSILCTRNGQPLSKLGLGNHVEMDPACVAAAYDVGVNYFFLYNLSYTSLWDALKPLAQSHRESVAIATGSNDRDLAALRTYREQACERLATNTLDVFYAEYINPTDSPDAIEAVLEELHAWKQHGWIRYVGATTHNHQLAGQLLAGGRCDVLMYRYNMAHRQAETSVFPTAIAAGVPIVAFTCTRWSSLLTGHTDWPHPPPQATECYRFALQHPAVRLAMMAPTTPAQVYQNASVLAAPPLTADDIERYQRYGSIIYGAGRDAFETRWP